jgi:DNA-directed RNA polymerase specialized sigma24 family protein
MLAGNRMNLSRAGEYATADDFQRLFASEMVDLFRLALFLTADAEKAEHCVILTMHESMASGSVLKGWLPVWTRNALIRNGIRVVTGIPGYSLGKLPQQELFRAVHKSRQSAIAVADEPAGVLLLKDFDRLVYVICVLEQYTARDCAVLLGRSRQEVRDAQKRASSQIAAFESECSHDPYASFPLPSLPGSEQRSAFDGSCGCLLD